MKTGAFKKALSLILCVLIAAAFAGCQAKKADAAEVDVRQKLASLMVSTDKLGLTGKYGSTGEIADGSIDPDLVGTWVMADGQTTYIYSEDGGMEMQSALYGNSNVKYTCLAIDGYKIICEDLVVSPELNDNVTEMTTQIGYTAYEVANDALYMVTVEETSEEFDSSQSTLVTMYRADESGSAAASIAKNPIALSSFDGTWTSDKGDFTIEGGTLKVGGDSYKLSMGEKNQLVVEKNGQSTVYSMGIGVMKQYEGEDRAQAVEKTMMSMNYTGADENDKPNLLSVMDDWKTEYDWDSWYYTGSFELQ